MSPGTNPGRESARAMQPEAAGLLLQPYTFLVEGMLQRPGGKLRSKT